MKKKIPVIVVSGFLGSGKTTLLRSINGLETASGGEIYFDNKIVNKNTILDVQKKTGMIFQEFNLVNNLSAINNVLTGLLNSSNKFLSLFYLEISCFNQLTFLRVLENYLLTLK